MISEAMQESRETFLHRHGLPDKPIIALLAGSRNGEIRTMMPTYMETARRMHEMPEYARFQFLVAAAPGWTKKDYDLA